MKSYLLLASFILFYGSAKSQDTTNVFTRIMGELKTYKVDTSAVPNDKLTAKINQLRQLRGGFNIDEAIEFKIQEDLQKGEKPKEEILKIANGFKSGVGKKRLDNAVTWIYREHFTYKEKKQLVRFYKTSAGKKMATVFPVIMLKTFVAAETIQKSLAQQ